MSKPVHGQRAQLFPKQASHCSFLCLCPLSCFLLVVFPSLLLAWQVWYLWWTFPPVAQALPAGGWLPRFPYRHHSSVVPSTCSLLWNPQTPVFSPLGPSSLSECPEGSMKSIHSCCNLWIFIWLKRGLRVEKGKRKWGRESKTLLA